MKKTTYLLLCLFLISQSLLAQQINSGEIITRGITFHDARNFDLAAKEYNKIPITDTNYYLAQYELALTYSLDSNKYNDALVVIEKGRALPMNEYSKSLLMLKGSVLDNLKRFDESHAVYDQILKEFPEYEQAYYVKAVVYYGQEDYDNAQKYFEKSLIRNPYHFRSHLLLAYCYYYQGRVTEAFITSHFALTSTNSKDMAELAVGQMKYFARANDSLVVKYKARDKKFYNSQYDEIADLLISRVSMKKKYQLKTSVDDRVTRQLQVVYELASYDRKSDNFVNNYYVPLIEKVWSEDQFDEMMLYLFSQYGYKNIDKAAKKNKKSVNALKSELLAYFRKISSTRVLKYSARSSAKNKYFVEGDKLIVANNELINDGDKKRYLFKGDIKYYDAGELRYIGKFDDQERKQGLWKYYNATGALTAVETFKDGKPNGSTSSNTYYGIKYEDKKYKNGEEYELEHYNGGVKSYRVVSQPNTNKSRLTLYNDNGTEEASYDMIDDKPADGKVTYKHDNGTVSDEVNFLNKGLDGLVKRYYRNGIIKEESMYANGKLNGNSKEYYPNGKLKSDYNYRDNELDGPYKEYYLNGNVDVEGNYSKGKISGSAKCYFFDGSIMNVAEYKRSKLTSSTYELESMKKYNSKSGGKTRFFFGDGTIASELTYNKNGNLEGSANYYYYNGVKREMVRYKDGKRIGNVTSYHFNGTKRANKSYKDGKLDGKYLEFESNGDTLRYGMYSAGKKVGAWREYENGLLDMIYTYASGKQHGPVLYYLPSGYYYKAKWFNYGVLYGYAEYDAGGNVTFNREFKNGNGTYLTHHLNGTEDFTVPVKNGKFNGPATSKFYDGTLEETMTYKNGEFVGTTTEKYYNGEVDRIIEYDQYGKNKSIVDYTSNGLLNKKVYYTDTNGVFNDEYYCSNQLFTKSSYVQDYEHGQRIYYGQNKEVAGVINLYMGKILSYSYIGTDGKLVAPILLQGGQGVVKTYYKNGKKALDFKLVKGKVEGDYAFYYQNGQIGLKKSYKNQLLIGTAEEYTPKGVKTYTASFNSKGNFDGLVQEYTADGKLAYEANYKNNQVMGDVKLLDRKSNKIITLTYKDGKIINAKK